MGKKQPSLEGHKSGQANEPLTKPAHALTFQEVINQTKCNPDDGLVTSEAKSRLEKHGNNDLGEDGGVSPGKILLRQVANAMTLVSKPDCIPKHTLIFADSYRCHGCQFRY
jgi:Na+-exporting ATPase